MIIELDAISKTCVYIKMLQWAFVENWIKIIQMRSNLYARVLRKRNYESQV